MVQMRPSGWRNLLLLLPPLVSAVGGILESWPVMAAAFVLVPAVILAAPVCRTFENMWSFILVFFVLPAPGITAALQLRYEPEFWGGDTVVWIVMCVILYFGVLGAAQILAGAAVRLLRGRQKGFLKEIEPDSVNFL